MVIMHLHWGFFNQDYSSVFSWGFLFVCIFSLFFFLIKQMTFIFHAQHNVTYFVSAIVMLRKNTAVIPKSTLKLQF